MLRILSQFMRKRTDWLREDSFEIKNSRNVYIQPFLYDAYYGEKKSDK